jgi:tight adherence protein B
MGENLMLVSISILIFLTVVGLILGIHFISIQDQQLVDKRLDNILSGIKDEGSEEGKRRKFVINDLFSLMGKQFTNLSFTKKLEDNLSKADVLLRTDEFIGLNILSALFGGLIGFALFGKSAPTAIFALLGIFLPGFVIYLKKQKRAALLNEEIGESLTGMSNSLRAGYSFQQAMDLISKENDGPLAMEYRRTLREINLGITTEQALQNLIQRAENDDLDLMVSAVLIQRQIGGNLAEVFDKIAETIRQRIRMQGEIKTLTAQGRISALVVGLLPIILAIILSMLDADYLVPLLNSQIGWFLIGGAIISESIGYLVLRNITNIKT